MAELAQPVLQPVLTCDQVRECEQRAAQSGVSLQGMMERAGAACAALVQAELPEGPVAVLCGPGNNGGDGYVAARLLAEAGREVRVFELAPGGTLPPEAAVASSAWGGVREPLGAFVPEPGEVVIDALFGAGLSRPLEGDAAEAVRRLNGSGAPVVAVDVPSGVMGDLGEVAGPAVRAAWTVTFGALKLAHVLVPASQRCGRVRVEPVGFEPYIRWDDNFTLHLNAPALWRARYPWPGAAAHKWRRGHLGVFAGGPWSTGAARLAARAGLRAGAGLVTVLCEEASAPVIAPTLTAVMLKPYRGMQDMLGHVVKMDVAVIGPGAGVTEETLRIVGMLASAEKTLVLDADALSVFAGKAGDLAQICAQVPVVMTPHVGEFERVFPGLLGRSANRVEAVREAAAETGGVVLLKGPDTVIATPDGPMAVNVHASPFLATAGSGDVLAGLIGGLLAQGMKPFDAACAGVWLHGDASLRAGPGMTSEDLDGALRESIFRLYAARD
ncbi:MAG: NAD(P)H-hydrate dehydratase [Hyphomonadaceae bacterium]